MKITNLAVTNRVAVLILAGLLAIAGLTAYVQLPKESAPQIEFATIVVTTVYPGASPDDIESIITQEIEREVSSVNGIDELRSTSSEGVSTVVIEFTPDVNVDDAKQEVRDAVDRAQVDFPNEAEEPIISELDSSEFPILTVNLAADYPLAQLRDTAEDLQDEVETVPGVLEVDLIGGLVREVQVNVDLARLQGYGLAFGDLIQTIQQENTNIPGGSIDIDRQNYLVRVDGEIDEPRAIEDLVIDSPGGTPVYVRDVAGVVFGFKDRDSYARLQVLQTKTEDGTFVPAENTEDLQVISLSIKKQPGENIIETVDQIRATITDFPMPTGTEVTYTGDASQEVETLVRDLENNIISGLIFVVAVLLFFLGVRNATLVGIAIPLSMALSFLVFAAMGQTLNFIILFSLIIALGMLVDNAVVIVENIYRFREEGYGRWEAAREATGEVGLAVAASTATTVAAFAPMLFWPGIIGRFMSYLPLTLIVTLSSSLFVALIINPVITGFLIRLDSEEKRTRSRRGKRIAYAAVAVTALVVGLTNWKTLVFAAVAIPLLVWLHRRFLEPATKRFQTQTVPRMTERYRDFIQWMLQRDYSGKRAMLKNTFALGAFTVGVILLVLGGATMALSQTAAFVFFIPGGLLLAAGVLAILFHAVETIMLGRGTSVRVGLWTAGVLGVLVVLLLLSGRIENPLVPVALMSLPGLIILGGIAGKAVFDDERTTWVLTDNRARLLTSTLALLVAIVGLFQVAPTGVVFFPDTDPNQVRVTLEAPIGTNIEASNQIALDAEERVRELLANNPDAEANVEDILTQVGVGGDAQFGGGASSPERSRITLNMVDYEDRAEPSNETLRQIRDQIQDFPGVTTSITKDQNGPPTGPPVNIEISGPEFDRISQIAEEIKARMREGSDGPNSELAGLVDIADNLNTGRPEFQVDIDRQRAAAFGLSTVQIAQVVRAAINGTEASTYRTGKDEYDITVRLRQEDRDNLAKLQSLTIPREDGGTVPLVSVADVVPSSGFGNITHLGQERVVTVEADAAEGVNPNELLGRVQSYLREYVAQLPPGYEIKYTGQSEDQAESFGFLTTALMLGLALISLILLAQFNSVGNPLIIIIATGLSLIGVLLGLIVTRTAFGLFTFIGIISLAGIVVNNAIVLIDYVEQLRARGLSKIEAVIEGGATRLRPVLLTAFTTVIGLIPLTFGINIDFVGLVTELDPVPGRLIGSENTQFWGPMGTAIISGLTFATFLTLVIVPVMYSTFDSIALRLGGFFGDEEAGATLMGEAENYEEVNTSSEASSANEASGETSSPDGSDAPGGNGVATPTPSGSPKS